MRQAGAALAPAGFREEGLEVLVHDAVENAEQLTSVRYPLPEPVAA